ncbi:MAG: response regulator [Candidatus Magnetoovum sp. WYHC-5]|nr:response regulator [Candidatus Magnetoovum sp. WYHC-5]
MIKNAQKLLIVDDEPINIEVLAKTLGKEYKIVVANNGMRALAIAQAAQPPDLILLDIMMPDMDGYEVCRRLRADIRTKNIPIIFITAMRDETDEAMGLSIGAVDYIRKPFSPSITAARVRNHMKLKGYQDNLEELVHEMTVDLKGAYKDMIDRLGQAAEFRDNETGQHIKRLSHACELVARHLGMSSARQELLFYASKMHDIGKIGISDSILLKPDKLTKEEWQIMKTHTTIGAKLLAGSTSELLEVSEDIALCHHEKWDGSGYPQGLQGEAIPLTGRITAICDVFDALISERPYKKAWPPADALREIVAQKGKHFDPYIVELFERIYPELLTLIKPYL